MHVDVLDVDSARSRDFFSPDVYFTPAYGRTAEVAQGGEWRIAVGLDGALLYPFLLRPLPDRLESTSACWDVASPYGYAGPYAAEGVTSNDCKLFREQIHEYFRSFPCVSEFIRFSPLLGNSEGWPAVDNDLKVVRRNSTVVVECATGYDECWTRYRNRVRTPVRRARRLGYVGTVRSAEKGDAGTDSTFRSLYEETMRRAGASSFYYFEEAYYEYLVDGNDLFIAEVRDPAGWVVASSLVLKHGEKAHYHLGGSDPEHLQAGANKLLFDEIIRWAAAHGCEEFHLGGGVDGNDGLFHFKRSFSDSIRHFETGQAVINGEEYRKLVRAQAAYLGVGESEIEAGEFFPAYRAQPPL